jgi:PAS domain S-box-containing protein
LVENAGDAIAVFDREQRYVYVNSAIEELWGTSPSTFVGTRPGDKNPDHQALQWRELVAEVSRTGERRTVEMTAKTVHGTRRFSSLFTPLADGYVCAVTRDVTDVRAARLLDAAARTMPTGMLIMDAANGRLLFVNDEAARMAGLAIASICSRDDLGKLVAFNAVGHRVSADAWPIVRALAGESVAGEEIEVHRPGGTPIVMSIHAAPVRDGDGHVIAAVSTWADITAQKRANQAAKFLADAGALLERLDPTTSLQRIAELAVPALSDWCFVHLLKGEVEHPIAVAMAGSDPEKVERARERLREPLQLSRDTALVRVLSGGPPELLDVDPEVLQLAARSPAHHAELTSRGYRSAIVAPLIGKNGVLGAMTFSMAESGRRYQHDDLAVLVEIARRTGIALDNVRLFAAEQEARLASERARDHTRRVYELATALSRAIDKHEVAAISTQASCRALGASAGFAWLLRDDDTLEMYGLPPDAPAELAQYRMIRMSDPLPLCDVVRTRQAMLFETPAQLFADYPCAMPNQRTRFGAWAVMPFVVGDRALGGVSLSFDQPHTFTPEERELLVAMIAQTSLAFERCELVDAERQARIAADAARVRERSLQQLAARLSTALTPNDVAAIACEAALDVFRARGASAYVERSGDAVALAVRSATPDAKLGLFSRASLATTRTPITDALCTGKLVWCADEAAIAAAYPHIELECAARGARACGAVPLEFHGRVIGTLGISFTTPRVATQADRELLAAIAELVAQALERARLYDAVRDGEEKLRLALTAARAATWSVDLATMLATRDRAYAEMVGDEPAHSEADFRQVHPDDRHIARAHFDRAMRDGIPYEPEVRLLRKDGRYMWIRAHGRVVCDANGKPTVMAGVMLDIDEAKRAQLRAEEERRINETLYRLGASFAHELDRDRLIQLITYEIGKLVGAESAHFAANGAALPEPEPASRLSIQVATHTGEQFGTLVFDAHEPARFTAEHVQLAMGIAGQAAVALENARLYTELREHKERLEGAIARARLADRRKDEFLAMLGHELRNPLAPIATALDLMNLKAAGALPKERAVIGRQVEHLSRLIDDLLDVSRITRGKIQLTRQVIEVGAVLAQAIETASPLLEKRMQRLSIDVPREGLSVDADPTRLAQVFQNILTNAAKYSDASSLIAVSATRAGQRVIVEVRDQGIGIPSELLPHLFDLFVQGERTIDRAEGGLGIGLAIAKSLCELHGGSIEARSSGSGHGSTFTVTLPLVAYREVAAPPPQSVMAQPHASGIRVLIVDDNIDAALLLRDLLAQLGHEPAVAHDGATALTVASEFKPNIAVLDIGLPIMDGYELARRLRERQVDGKLLLIAVTGYGQDADRARSREAGFDHHLVKPVAIDSLMHLIVR